MVLEVRDALLESLEVADTKLVGTVCAAPLSDGGRALLESLEVADTKLVGTVCAAPLSDGGRV